MTGVPPRIWSGANGVKLAYKSFLGPVRGGIGIHADRKPVYYLSVGYDIDAFEFSRR